MLNRGNDGKKRGGGFTKLCSLSPALQEFVGASELARTEVNTVTWLLSYVYLALDEWYLLIMKRIISLTSFLLCLFALRLSRSFGHIFGKIICKTKTIGGRFCPMRDWGRSSMSIRLICSKWIKLWPSISGHWILRVLIHCTIILCVPLSMSGASRVAVEC